MYLHELSAICSGAICTNFRAAKTIPRSSVVASTVGVALVFPLAIAPLAVLHLDFGAGGLLFAVAVVLGLFLESPFVYLN